MFKKVIKKLFIVGMIFVFFGAGLAASRAEDDEDDEDDDREEEEVRTETSSSSSSDSSSSGKTETTVKTDVKIDKKTTLIKDSDGDGILDSEDSNPSISEIFIVEDQNKNGIVDKFETNNLAL